MGIGEHRKTKKNRLIRLIDCRFFCARTWNVIRANELVAVIREDEAHTDRNERYERKLINFSEKHWFGVRLGLSEHGGRPLGPFHNKIIIVICNMTATYTKRACIICGGRQQMWIAARRSAGETCKFQITVDLPFPQIKRLPLHFNRINLPLLLFSFVVLLRKRPFVCLSVSRSPGTVRHRKVVWVQ